MNYTLSTEKTTFNLADTLNCGQCFRFEQQEDMFVIIFKNQLLRAKQTENEVIFYDTTPKEYDDIWKEYFDIQTDYSPIKNLFSSDETLQKAMDFCGGLHILKQDCFEALMSFIVSQNNNIPRIKGSIKKFCERFGEQIEENYFGFPKLESLQNITQADLAGLSLGYRDEYIIDCVKKISQNEINLNLIKTTDIENARKALRTIKGVGPKVCECALLFGFYRVEAFPIDTWVKKVLATYYKSGFPKQFNQYAGIAQQYLFHYIRTNQNK